MPSHFSTLGFDVEQESDFFALAERVAALAAPLETAAGTYLRWSDGSGAELWLQLGKNRELVRMNPHFTGSARARVHLTSWVRRRDDSVLDAAFHAWAEPLPGAEHRAYPFVFDCPAARSYEELVLPGTALLQVAAFAHEVEVSTSVEAFELAQRARGLEYRARSFVPTGLLRSEHGSDEPQSTASFAGVVLDSARRVNGLTQRPFYWAHVASLAAEYDVVIDASSLNEAPPIGGVVSGLFWLTGKLVSHATAQAG